MSQVPGSNPYFPNYSCPREQELLEELVQEATAQVGIDVFYLPRTLVAYDEIYGEDAISAYNQALSVAVFLKTVDGFEGDGVFFSKFGLEIRDQVVFSISRRAFENEIELQSIETRPRPFEGDCIYYPFNKKVFQIKYVNYLPIHYPLGTLPAWDVTCELFEYSNETFSTGITDIDEIQTKFTTNLLDFSLVDENNNYVVDERGNYLVSTEYNAAMANTDNVFDDSTEIQSEAVDVLDWSDTDPFSESDWGEGW